MGWGGGEGSGGGLYVANTGPLTRCEPSFPKEQFLDFTEYGADFDIALPEATGELRCRRTAKAISCRIRVEPGTQALV
jgi:hypothetical protein